MLATEVQRLRTVLRGKGATDDECGAVLPPLPAAVAGPIPERTHRCGSASASHDCAASGCASPTDAPQAVAAAVAREEAADIDMRRRKARATAGRAGVALMAVVFAFSMCLFNLTDMVHTNAMPSGFAATAGAGATRGRVLHMYNDAYDTAAAALRSDGGDSVAPAGADAFGAELDAGVPPMPRLWSLSAFVTLVLHITGVPHIAELVIVNLAVVCVAFVVAVGLITSWSAGVVFHNKSYYAVNGSALPTSANGAKVDAEAATASTADAPAKASKHSHGKGQAKATHSSSQHGPRRPERTSTGKLVPRPRAPAAFPVASSAPVVDAVVDKWYRALCADEDVNVAPPLSRAASTNDLPAHAARRLASAASKRAAKPAGDAPIVPRGVGALVADDDAGDDCVPMSCAAAARAGMRAYGSRSRAGTDPMVSF